MKKLFAILVLTAATVAGAQPYPYRGYQDNHPRHNYYRPPNPYWMSPPPPPVAPRYYPPQYVPNPYYRQPGYIYAPYRSNGRIQYSGPNGSFEIDLGR